MKCYKSGGCGVYENRSCSECPASKPSYLENGISNTELISQLRMYGAVELNGKMGEECYVPKRILRFAADRIEVLQSAVSNI